MPIYNAESDVYLFAYDTVEIYNVKIDKTGRHINWKLSIYLHCVFLQL